MMNIPDNSITKEIKEIVALCGELASEYGKDASYFSEPASEADINYWEHENKTSIPESYKDWLRFSNGSRIINGTAKFFGLKMMRFSDRLPSDYVIIGELIGDGEYLCFSCSTGKITRYNHGKFIEYQSFKEVLNLILDII